MCITVLKSTAWFVGIDKTCLSEGDIRDTEKSNKLNYGAFYQGNAWIISQRSVVVCTMFGKKRACVIGVNLDDLHAFASVLDDIL